MKVYQCSDVVITLPDGAELKFGGGKSENADGVRQFLRDVADSLDEGRTVLENKSFSKFCSKNGGWRRDLNDGP